MSPLILWAFVATAAQSASGPIAKDATLEKLGAGFGFAEGPTPDRWGNVYFTDQPNDRIMRWNTDRTIVEWMKPCGRANGLAMDHKGYLIACADENNQLWRINARHEITGLAQGYGGKLLNGPNDLWIRPDGGLYLTDPLYARPYWKRDPASQQAGRYVFFLPKDQSRFVPVATDLKQPNGIAGTPDGRTLYVSDIDDGKTYRYRMTPGGELTEKTLFCSMGSDGMTVDSAGNVYLTGKGVTIFNVKGEKIGHIDVPEDWTANVTFGGEDRRMLFITASHSIYGIRMRTKGTE